MHFKISPNLTTSTFRISHKDKILSVGSCFSSNISNELTKLKFDVLDNPFGTIYNPMSIIDSLNFNNESFSNSFYQRDEKWVSLKCHSDINADTEQELLQKLKAKSENVRSYLKEIQFLIITLGTSKLYTHLDRNIEVANCHKISQKEFKAEYISHERIVNTYSQELRVLKNQNPNLKVIITVSPVRYLADGMAMNSLSKSNLLIAALKLDEMFDWIEYFPSYELLIDDLRDYRFYAEDLVHPNKIAINYVFEAFSKMYFDTPTSDLNERILKILSGLEHRPFNKTGESYHKFELQLQKNIALLPELVKNRFL